MLWKILCINSACKQYLKWILVWILNHLTLKSITCGKKITEKLEFMQMAISLYESSISSCGLKLETRLWWYILTRIMLINNFRLQDVCLILKSSLRLISALFPISSLKDMSFWFSLPIDNVLLWSGFH